MSQCNFSSISSCLNFFSSLAHQFHLQCPFDQSCLLVSIHFLFKIVWCLLDLFTHRQYFFFSFTAGREIAHLHVTHFLKKSDAQFPFSEHFYFVFVARIFYGFGSGKCCIFHFRWIGEMLSEGQSPHSVLFSSLHSSASSLHFQTSCQQFSTTKGSLVDKRPVVICNSCFIRFRDLVSVCDGF